MKNLKIYKKEPIKHHLFRKALSLALALGVYLAPILTHQNVSSIQNVPYKVQRTARFERIASFNLKDRYNDIFYNGVVGDKDYAKTVAEYLVDNDISLLGTQELVAGYSDRLEGYLPLYGIYGEYRQGGRALVSYANERCGIVTDEEVISTTTTWLPYVPKNLGMILKNPFDIMPRVATVSVINFDSIGETAVINTHLDYKLDEIQESQLDALYNLIEEAKANYPVIVMGDFNMILNKPIFRNFILRLEKIGIYLVQFSNTKENDKNIRIDQAFISNNLVLEGAKLVYDGVALTSDHPLLEFEVSRK